MSNLNCAPHRPEAICERMVRKLVSERGKPEPHGQVYRDGFIQAERLITSEGDITALRRIGHPLDQPVLTVIGGKVKAYRPDPEVIGHLSGLVAGGTVDG